MKKVLFALTGAAILFCSSCGNSQKPSPRVSVWDNNSDTTTVGVKLSSVKVFVPFKRLENGLAEVQVSLNGVPFNMWWDTGASVTCISLLELQKLAKEDKISLDDYVGPAMSQIADGSTTESAIFTIKEIYIQGQDNKYLILKDIAAMVSPSAKAPLLIGQNVINNLPKHSFNETDGMIEFEK